MSEELQLFKIASEGNPDTAISLASQMHGVDESLVRAMQSQESEGDQSAVSPKGARGRMQLMPGTAKGLGVNPDDEIENIYGGVKYLSQQMKTFKGDVPLALAAYNAGPGAVEKHGGVPPYKETQGYVGRIMDMLGPSSAEASEGPGSEQEQLAKIAGVDPVTLAPLKKVESEEDQLARIAGVGSGALKSITSFKGTNCGDALANFFNAGPLKGTGHTLPNGGIGPGELADLGKSLGANVYNKENLSMDKLTPGMVIHMTRQPGDKNYQYGDHTHIGMVDTDEQGGLVFRSYTAGKGWRAEPINQQFIEELPSQVIATNPVNPKSINRDEVFQQGNFWSQAESQGEAIGQVPGFGDRAAQVPGADEASPGTLFKKTRDYLGLNREPWKMTPVMKSIATEYLNKNESLEDVAARYPERGEYTQEQLEFAAARGLGVSEIPGSLEWEQMKYQDAVEIRAVLNSYIDAYALGIPSLISQGLTGEPLKKPQTVGGTIAGQAMGLAGQIMGPFKLISKMTGSYLFPTPSGLRSIAYLIAQASAKGSVDQGLLQGLSRVIPAAIEDEDYTKWSMDVINHAKSGALVGLTFPLLGAVPTKAGRIAVGFAAMDYMRAAPGKWSTLGDIYEAAKKWDGDSKKQFAELAYQYMVDLYFASKVPTFKQVYQSHSMNVLMEELNKVKPEDAEQAILGATGQRGTWTYDEKGEVSGKDGITTAKPEKPVPEGQILQAIKKAVDIEGKERGVKFDEGLDERIAAAVTEALKPTVEVPGQGKAGGAKGPIVLETPPTVKELNPDVTSQIEKSTPQELAGKGGTPDPDMVQQWEDWQRTEMGRNRDYQLAQVRAEYPGISDQQANFILEERGFGTGGKEQPVVLGPDGKPVQAPKPAPKAPETPAVEGKKEGQGTAGEGGEVNWYHGTSKIGQIEQSGKLITRAEGAKRTNAAAMGNGIYLYSDIENAKAFVPSNTKGGVVQAVPKDVNLLKLDTNIPEQSMEWEKIRKIGLESPDKATQYVKSKGYDGVEWVNQDGSKAMVVYDSAKLGNIKKVAERTPPKGELASDKDWITPAPPAEAKEPWEMTAAEHTVEGKRLYEELGNEGFVNSDFRTYSDGASHDIHQEAQDKFPNNSAKQAHYAAVKRAIQEGHPVPASVLADYPDLKPKAEGRGEEQPTLFEPKTTPRTGPSLETAQRRPNALSVWKLTRSWETPLPPKGQKKFALDAVEKALKGPFAHEGGDSHIVIDIPGDGEYRIENQQMALETMKKKFGSFPVGDVKSETYRYPSTKPTGRRPNLSGSEGIEYVTEYIPRKGSIVVKDFPIGQLGPGYADGFYSDGKAMVKMDKPKERTDDSTNKRMPDFIKKFSHDKGKLAIIEGEYKDPNSEIATAMLRSGDVRSLVNVKYLDAILTEHPNARPYMTDAGSAVVFKDGKKLVGVVMPMRGHSDGRDFARFDEMKTPEPTLTPEQKADLQQSNEGMFKDLVKFAADTPEQLRASDLDRVVKEAEDRGVGDEFVKWLKDQPLNERARREFDLSYSEPQPAKPGEGKVVQPQTEADIKAEWEAGGRKVMHGGPDLTQVVEDLRSSVKETKSRARQRWDNLKAEMREFFRPGEAPGAEAGRIALLQMIGKKSTEMNQAMGRFIEFRDMLKDMTEAEWTRQATIWQRGGKNNTDFDRVMEINNEILDSILPRIREFKAISYQENYLRQAWNNWSDPAFRENLANFLDGKPFQNHHDLDPQGRPKLYQATFTEEGGYEAHPTGEVAGEAATEVPQGLRRGPGAGRSLTGGRGYFKKKVISDWQTGMMLGGTPKFKNPMDLIAWDLGQKLQFVHGNEFIKFGRQAGWMKWSTRGKRPADWAKINDPTSLIVKPYLKELEGETRPFSDVEGSYVKIAEAAAKGDRPEVMRLMGELEKSYDMTEKPDYEAKAAIYELYAPKDIARIVNNWLAPGLRGHEWYDLYRDIADPLRRLGVIGPYHLRFIWNAAFAQGTGTGLSKGMGELLSGDINAFMKTMGKGAGVQATAGLSAFAKQLKMGMEGAKALYGQADDPVSLRAVKDMAETGGNLPEPTSMIPLAKYMGKGMYRALVELQRVHPFRAIDNALDSLMEPIARGVSYTKVGGFMILDRALNDRLEAKYSKMGEMTPELAAQKDKDISLGRIDINKHLDNIYGQMNYDALLWNKSLKDLLFFAIKFPGWNIGSGRWLAAMVSGAVKSPWGTTTDYEKDSLRMGLGLVVNMGITNMMLYWFINGKPPDDITELYTKGVWTGGFTKSGNKEYIRDANYWRDAWGMTPIGAHGEFDPEKPFATIKAKAADIWRIPAEIFDNKEAYTGYQIATPGKPGQWAGEYGKYLGKQMLPYAIRSASQATTPAGKIGPNVGWTVTPGRLTDTPAMKMMHEIMGAQAPQMVTVEKQEGRERKRDVMAFAYEGDEGKFQDSLDNARAEGKITATQYKNYLRDGKEILDDPQYGPLRNSFRKITDLKQAIEIFKIATPEERWALQDMMQQKWAHAKSETRYQLEDKYLELQDAMGGTQ